MFDYDDSINLAFDAKIAGKKLVTAKHELLTKTGEFLFLAHSDRELALRMQMVEEDIEKVAHRKLSNVSDSKAKLVRAIFDEWQLRHASCSMCKAASGRGLQDEYETPRVTQLTEKGNVSKVDAPCTTEGCTNDVYQYPGMPRDNRNGKCYPHGGVSAEGYVKDFDSLPPRTQSKTANMDYSFYDTDRNPGPGPTGPGPTRRPPTRMVSEMDYSFYDTDRNPGPGPTRRPPTRMVSERRPQFDPYDGRTTGFGHTITTDNGSMNYALSVREEPCLGEGCKYCAEAAPKK